MEIVYFVATSLDGYIATPDGGVEWLEGLGAEGEDHGFEALDASIGALLMGSATYEFALAQPEWMSPHKPSWVFTRRDLPVAHPTVTLTGDEPAEVVAALESQGIARAWLVGGGKLATSFRQAGLITEYVVSVIPVLLGSGLPLFAPSSDRAAPERLTLVEARPHPSGIVQLFYRK